MTIGTYTHHQRALDYVDLAKAAYELASHDLIDAPPGVPLKGVDEALWYLIKAQRAAELAGNDGLVAWLESCAKAIDPRHVPGGRGPYPSDEFLRRRAKEEWSEVRRG